jgi:glycerophosphoryl diester phosphodiesterase
LTLLLTNRAYCRDNLPKSPDDTSPWLSNLSFHSFFGPSISERISQAAHSIGAHILSPSAQTDDEWFTSKEMISEAHRLGIEVKPWTVNNLSIVEELVEWGVDGIITDCKSFLIVPVYALSECQSCLPE